MKIPPQGVKHLSLLGLLQLFRSSRQNIHIHQGTINLLGENPWLVEVVLLLLPLYNLIHLTLSYQISSHED